MATMQQIEAIVREVAGAQFPSAKISRVITEPGIASTGEGAVRIMIVFDDPVPQLAIGEKFLSALTDIWTRLDQIGEERMPILRYASAHELETHDGPES